MFFFSCEQGFVPDNGQNDVTDGSVENFDFDWNDTAETEPIAEETTAAEAEA